MKRGPILISVALIVTFGVLLVMPARVTVLNTATTVCEDITQSVNLACEAPLRTELKWGWLLPHRGYRVVGIEHYQDVGLGMAAALAAGTGVYLTGRKLYGARN